MSTARSVPPAKKRSDAAAAHESERRPAKSLEGDSVDAESAPSGDGSFVIEIVEELAKQNQRTPSPRARTPDEASRAAPASGPLPVSTNAVVPPSGAGPADSAADQMPSVIVSDPRRMPTIRIPRKKAEAAQPASPGRTERGSVPPPNTLRSGLSPSPTWRAQPNRGLTWSRILIIAFIVFAIVAAIIVARSG